MYISGSVQSNIVFNFVNYASFYDMLVSIKLFICLSSSQNLETELEKRFRGVNFYPSTQFVQLSGDSVELMIPSSEARQQGYSIVSDRRCKVC